MCEEKLLLHSFLRHEKSSFINLNGAQLYIKSNCFQNLHLKQLLEINRFWTLTGCIREKEVYYAGTPIKHYKTEDEEECAISSISTEAALFWVYKDGYICQLYKAQNSYHRSTCSPRSYCRISSYRSGNRQCGKGNLSKTT